MRKVGVLALLLVAATPPLLARESLGVFASWGAFHDPETPRCYAIAVPEPDRSARDYQPFATIGTWPKAGIRGQVHFRLSRRLAESPRITLSIAGRSFALTGGGGDAWSKDKSMDAAIVAAMRSASSMSVRATDARGRRFSSTYSLSGAATAMDAATLACARRR